MAALRRVAALAFLASLWGAAGCGAPPPDDADRQDAPASLSAPASAAFRSSSNGRASASDIRSFSHSGARAQAPDDVESSSDPQFAASLASERMADQPGAPQARALRLPGAVSPRGPPASSGSGRTVAVIINGDDGHTASTHSENVKRGIKALTSHYGIAPGDLIVLSPEHKPATRQAVGQASLSVAGALGPADRLVIYTTGHGNRSGDQTWLWLEGRDYVVDSEFMSAYFANNAGRIVYIGDQCYSGGFVEQAAAMAMSASDRKEVIALSSTDAENSTWCGSFIRPFFEAFANPAVSEREAFDYAWAEHKRRSGRGDPGTNSQFWTNSLAPLEMAAR